MGEAYEGALFFGPFDDWISRLSINRFSMLKPQDNKVPSQDFFFKSHSLGIEVPFGVIMEQAFGGGDLMILSVY